MQWTKFLKEGHRLDTNPPESQVAAGGAESLTHNDFSDTSFADDNGNFN